MEDHVEDHVEDRACFHALGTNDETLSVTIKYSQEGFGEKVSSALVSPDT